ncbi:TRAP transporter large permease subunit [Oceanobacillus profundus]|uniref:TRAP transporter large permease subunit n=1 Tax=Oceanobacillus profundus TaxID=372463 RepID=A0A417YCG5_9BACI|nr:TRAP transporter large permease subunit [Oceanobacillus profundus]RHW30256.1 TRAP transporter large permease subunit [Oceanobacillus profundus]
MKKKALTLISVLLFVAMILAACGGSSAGMDPVHFGVVLILALGIGLVTPPVGSVLFVGSAIGRISIEKSAKAMLPFYGVMFLVLLLVAYIPEFSLFLPNLFGQ